MQTEYFSKSETDPEPKMFNPNLNTNSIIESEKKHFLLASNIKSKVNRF